MPTGFRHNARSAYPGAEQRTNLDSRFRGNDDFEGQ